MQSFMALEWMQWAQVGWKPGAMVAPFLLKLLMGSSTVEVHVITRLALVTRFPSLAHVCAILMHLFRFCVFKLFSVCTLYSEEVKGCL